MNDTVARLKEFCRSFNSSGDMLDEYGMWDSYPTYSALMERSYRNQFCSREPRKHIGLSEIGKPGVLLGLKKVGAPAEVIDMHSRLRFHLGDMFEALIVNILKAERFNVTGTQIEIEHDGTKGHIDGIVNGDTVIEIKTMSDQYFKRFTLYPNDTRGYLTQLNMYCDILKLPGVWMCLNKSTYELAVVELVSNPDIITRAHEVIAALKSVVTFTDLLENFEAPEAVPELYKKQPTGKFLVPESMKYCQFQRVFYEMEEGINQYKKPTWYVTGYKKEDEAHEEFIKLMEIPF